MKITHIIVWASFSLLSIVGFCSAEERTFQLTGAVTEVPFQLDAQFSVDNPIAGTYTFETTASDTLPANPNVGSYVFSVSNFEMTIGPYVLNSTGIGGDIVVEDNVGGEDSYTVVALAEGAILDGLDPQVMALQLRDSSGIAFGSETLPVDPPLPSLFDSPDITIDFFDGSNFVRLTGALETLTVPEPTAAWLAWFGGLVMFQRVGSNKRVGTPGASRDN